MKRVGILICVALLALSASAAEKKKGLLKDANEKVSGQGYGMAGCGLGSILFGDQSGIIQVFAATTNGLYGNNTIGMTIGTSNCDVNGGSASASLFIEANKEALAKDVARGNGETLASLSQLMGCKDSALLGAKLQGKYDTLFPSQAVEADAVSKSIVNAIQSDAELASSCI